MTILHAIGWGLLAFVVTLPVLVWLKFDREWRQAKRELKAAADELKRLLSE